MIIRKIQLNDKTIELCGNVDNAEKNIFTLVVGRNGCGKSALLKKICQINISSLLFDTETQNLQFYLDSSDRTTSNSSDTAGSMTYEYNGSAHSITIERPDTYISALAYFKLTPTEQQNVRIRSLQNQYMLLNNTIRRTTNDSPVTTLDAHPKIIAVSSSPFDKFPIIDERSLHHQEKQIKNHYFYRGARAKSRNTPKNYLTAKFDQLGSSLINFFLAHENRKNEILPLFSYLGLSSKFKLILKFNDHFRVSDISGEASRKPAEVIDSVRFFKGIYNDPTNELTQDLQQQIIESAEAIRSHFNRNTDPEAPEWFHNKIYELELDINSDSEIFLLREFSILAEHDVIDLENIEFTKNKSKSSFLLTEASSGELCILFNILSIAGAISNNSVILLDEPELSLHPEWQRDFLPLVEAVFANYKNCHFIIATHSPQIVSSMSLSNSYVVNLEENPVTITDGSQTHMQSSDYQLAYIFKTPGHKNEYLITQIIEALSLISNGQEPDEEFLLRTNKLIGFYDLVPEHDPVKKLLSTLTKAMSAIAND